jgi:ABC-type sugar transport system substrate-binding protein
VLLIALLSAAGVAIGLAQGVPSTDEAAQEAETIGVVGGKLGDSFHRKVDRAGFDA